MRFIHKKKEKFYCYSNVPPDVWEQLRKLNDSGGVGSYLINTIVQHPKKYPFDEFVIREFKVAPKEKKMARVPAQH